MGARLLPVRVKMPDDLPPGYRIEGFAVNPSEVLVKGPENLLSGIENVWITPTLEQILEEKDLTLPVVVFPGNRGTGRPVHDRAGGCGLFVQVVRGFPRRTVPVRVELRGEPDGNFQIEAVAVDPPEVMIQGPRESSDRIDQVFLEPLNVSGLSGDTTRVVPLENPAEDVQIVQDTSVRVRLLLAERIESRLYARIPVRLTGRSIYPGWRVEPSEVSVYLEGAPSDLDAAESSGSPVEVVVDVTNLVSQKITVPVKVNIKFRGLTLSGVEPANVTVFALTE